MSQVPETNPELATKGPLPEGWTTEYSPQWNAWYYVDTKSANPQAVWTHPHDTSANPSPAYTADPHTGHSTTPTPTASTGAHTNPDTRPLPEGWTSQYSDEHKTFFYVNERAANPGSTVTWKHPSEDHPPATDPKSPATASTQAHVDSTAPVVAAATGGSTTSAPIDPASAVPQNLPPGWKAEFDTNYKAWYYINTNDPSAGPTWTLPAGAHIAPTVADPDPHAPSTTTQPSYSETSPKKTTEPLPSTGTATTPDAGGPTMPNPTQGAPSGENPDKRPLPTGWITKYDENYKVWYYVDTTKPGNVASWEHPADIKPAPGAPSTPGAPPANQQYGAQPQGAASGKGIEGLIGGSAGKMVGGLFGAKGRAQMDMFANKLAPEVSKLKGKYAGGSSGAAHGQQAYGAPPPGAPGHYGGAPTTGTSGQYGAPPAPAHGYGAPTTPGQGGYGAPPTTGQEQYGPSSGHGPAPGHGTPPSGQYNPATGHPPAPGAYGAAPTGQQQHGGHGGGGFMGQGGIGGLASQQGLNQLAGKFGKFGLGKK